MNPVANRNDCPHRPPCPGCPRFGEADLDERTWARLREITREAGLPDPPIHQGAAGGHRHRARLAVRGKPQNPKIGLFQANSHRIVHIPHCSVHHPLINETSAEIREAIKESGVEPYADRPHRGVLRTLQLVVERSSNRIQVVLVGCGESPDVLGDLPGILERRLGDRLQGLFFNAQPERSNTILGPKMVRLMGEEAIRESLRGVQVFFPPGAFGQNHLPLFERAVDRIAELVPPNQTIAEYYCGVGSIGLSLLRDAKALRFNERSPDGLSGLELGLAERPDDERKRATILAGAASERLEGLVEADLVLVDPPRRGLDAPLTNALAESPPARLIYLSCGLDSLVSDLRLLQQNRTLVLRGLEVFNFFPFTEHVETLVWLDRV